MHVALISFHFMNVTAAGQSTAKVARALTDAGCRVTVFCADNNWMEGEKIAPREGLLAGITIHRIATDEARLAGWQRTLAARDGASWAWSRLAALANLYYGDSPQQEAWARAATDRVLEILRDDPADVLLSRLNHFLSHYVGLRVVRRFRRLPWVAYFSDPWPFHRFPPPYNSGAGRVLRCRLDQIMSRILRRADSLIFPSTHQRDLQLRGRRARFREKAVIAPHIGNVWHVASAKARTDTLRILHAGFLMKERRTEALWAATRALLDRRVELRPVLRLEFIGRFDGGVLPDPPPGLEDTVVYHPYVRPENMWRWLQGADVLLLIEANLEIGIFFPSKLADYLGAERPILALSPGRGVAADLLADGPSHGLMAPPEDASAIERALETAADAWLADRLSELTPAGDAGRIVQPANVVACYQLAFEQAGARTSGAT